MWAIGEWALGDMRFQKMFGLYSVECHWRNSHVGWVLGWFCGYG